jgi:hypothetical protein
MKFSSELLPASRVSLEGNKKIFEIMDYSFEGEYKSEIRRQLEDRKTKIILIKNDENIIGFHLFKVLDSKDSPGSVKGIFAGDLAIKSKSQSARKFLLQSILSELFNSQIVKSNLRWFWLLPLASVSLYEMFNKVFKKFYPAPDHVFPPFEKSLLHDFATQGFGHYYDPDSLLISYPHPYYPKENFISTANGDVKDLLITFFKNKNPNANEGKDLACITELNKSNLTEYGLKLVTRNRRKQSK